MSDTLIPALVLVGSIGLIIGVLVFINNRDRKKQAQNNNSKS